MSENGTLASFESVGGARIDRIRLQAFPGFWTNVYVIQKDGYCVLIDAGSGTDTSHGQLLSGLKRAGIEPSDLTHILLTHAHIDHFGGFAKLRPITKAGIGVHELDVQTVAHHESRIALIGRRLASFLAETGLPRETCEHILSIYHFSKSIYQSVPVDFTFEATDMQLGPFEIVHLPGHCPGHVAIRLDDVIFCGDMVVEGVTPHLSPEIISPNSGLGHYIESLSRFQRWAGNARLIFNGHNEVITDLPAQIESTKHNIVRRIGRAVEALREPLTIEQVCRAVYGESGGYNQLLVIEKTGAYMEYLYERGLVEIIDADEVGSDLPARYRRLKDEALSMAELEKRVQVHTHAGRQVP